MVTFFFNHCWLLCVSLNYILSLEESVWSVFVALMVTSAEGQVLRVTYPAVSMVPSDGASQLTLGELCNRPSSPAPWPACSSPGLQASAPISLWLYKDICPCPRRPALLRTQLSWRAPRRMRGGRRWTPSPLPPHTARRHVPHRVSRTQQAQACCCPRDCSGLPAGSSLPSSVPAPHGVPGSMSLFQVLYLWRSS